MKLEGNFEQRSPKPNCAHENLLWGSLKVQIPKALLNQNFQVWHPNAVLPTLGFDNNCFGDLLN